MEIIKPDVKKAVQALEDGNVLICPTDTIYGLICDANNKKAVGRLYKIKKRPKRKPLPIFVSNITMAKKLAHIDKKQEEFLEKVWPGGVTVVLKSKKKGTIGLRMPNHKFVLDLVEHIGPLAESSANMSGEPASAKINDVLAQFRGKEEQPDLAIDAGDLPPSKPSTVEDLRFFPPKILRP